MAGKLGRKPYSIFEIDVPRCTRVYGSAPCTAALSAVTPNKCYNTRKTCQDVPNFLAGTVTHSYVMNIDGMPKKAGYFPMLQSVSTRAAEINLSGIDPKSTALGVRASGTAVLNNARDNGSFTDPYFSGRRDGTANFYGTTHKAENQGTHWGKFFARNPYYIGLNCRVKRGYVGDDPATMPVEHYVVTDATGPGSSGVVNIQYKDVLDLADNNKAVCPAVSTGKLLTDIGTATGPITLTPAGVGGDEYPASGLVRIGNEIMTFTRAGDVLTITARGAEGTTAASHKALDVVQLCVVFDDGLRFCDVAETLLTDYAGIDPAQINTSAWQSENDNWLAGLGIKRTIISKSTGVKTLIGELCQLGVMIFPDVQGKEILYRVNAPLAPGETYYDVTEANNINEGTIDVGRGEDQRISAMVLYHGVISWTESTDSAENYAKATVAQIGDDPYEQSAIKEMTVRWYGRDGDDAAAGVVTERILARYENPPKIISGELDVKDRQSVSLASRLRISSDLNEGFDGIGAAELMQANYVEYTGDDRVKIRAQTYSLDGRFGFWMQNPLPDYDTATDTEKSEGAFWFDDTETAFTDGSGPYVYF